jgi:hypothetical protein
VNDLLVVVMTSDKYIEAVRPFMHLLNKYWRPNPSVLVSGFTPPEFELPANADFYSVGEFKDYPVNKWTDALYRTLNHIDEELIVLMLEDYWLTRPVNVEVVRIMRDYMVQFENVVKVDLRSDRLYAHGAETRYGHAGFVDLVKSMPGSPYHMSLMTGIWRVEHLKKVIQPGQSPWDVEIAGTTILSHMQDLLVLGTRQNPIEHALAFRGGEHHQLLLDELQPHDIQELESLGYLEPWMGE